jgi:hypothetical protein
MVCQCGGTWKGIKSKVGGELDISLQALFAYLCVFYVLVIALIVISPLILTFYQVDHILMNGFLLIEIGVDLKQI